MIKRIKGYDNADISDSTCTPSYLLTRISAVKHHARIQLSGINIFKSKAWFISILTKANSSRIHIQYNCNIVSLGETR